MDGMFTLGQQHQFSRANVYRHSQHHRAENWCRDDLGQAYNRKCVVRMQFYLAAMQQLTRVRRCHRHQGCTLGILDKNWAGHRIILNNDSAIRPRKEAPLPQEVIGLVIPCAIWSN
jgi:hypothetical protein